MYLFSGEGPVSLAVLLLVETMSQYTASTPSDGQVKPEIRAFFEKFYEISDSPEAHEKYSEQFTKYGKLIMGPTESNGRSGKFPAAQDFLLFA